jgi:hypothetical protein
VWSVLSWCVSDVLALGCNAILDPQRHTKVSINSVSCSNCRLPESMDASNFFFDLTELHKIRAAPIIKTFLSNVHSNRFFRWIFITKLDLIWLWWSFQYACETCWCCTAPCRKLTLIWLLGTVVITVWKLLCMILYETCQQCATWKGFSTNSMPFSVNITKIKPSYNRLLVLYWTK